MGQTVLGSKNYMDDCENTCENGIAEKLRSCPIPNDEILANLGLFLTSKNLSRILFMDFIYRQIVNIPGVIMEMGTRWGNNTAIFSSLRSIYEPFHRHREIIAFDTFEGFPSISEKDGASDLMQEGNLSVGENYYQYLCDLMILKEQREPINHIKKHKIIKGEAVEQLIKYLDDNPHTIISLVYFDFDLYEPTKKSLEILRPYLISGSVLVFDELNDHDSPGETVAVQEIFGLNNLKLRRLPFVSRISYVIIGE